MFEPSKHPCRIVILGGGYAGLTTAQHLRQQHINAEITLIDATSVFVERHRLHQASSGQASQYFSYQSFLNSMGVQFIQGQVSALNPNSSRITFERRRGETETIAFDYLVYALGSSIDLMLSGVKEYAHVLDSDDAVQQLHGQLRQLDHARILVVSDGSIGIETAAELVESMPHLQVALAMDQPLHASDKPNGFADQTIQYLQQALQQRHIEQYYGRIVRIEDGQAIQENGEVIQFDICIWTSDFKPSSLAKQAGLYATKSGEIVVDKCLRSLTHPQIIVVGGNAHIETFQAGTCRMGGATAVAMGAAAAKTIVSLLQHKKPPAFQFLHLFRSIYLGRHDGVIQFVDCRDAPRDVVWTGKKAAEWMAYVVSYTLKVMGLDSFVMHPAALPLSKASLCQSPQLMKGLMHYA
jgi:NADH dehydrogenase